MGINVASLFDGMSCGQLALERAGIEVDNYFASEIDKYAIQVTQKNYPNTIQLGDVTNWRDWDLPEIDLLIGGSPCQGFSFAGKVLNFNDPRSKLFFEFVDILNKVKPRYFLLENVVMKKEYEDLITKFLGVEPIKINSSLVSAQNRVRLYWTNIPRVTTPHDKGISCTDILEKGTEWRTIGAIRGRYENELKENGKRKTSQYIEFRKDNKTNCLTTVQKDNVVTPYSLNERTLATNIEYRYLTPLEYERLQTVPEGYTEGVSNTQRYKMLGNGWTVDVIAHIFNQLVLPE